MKKSEQLLAHAAWALGALSAFLPVQAAHAQYECAHRASSQSAVAALCPMQGGLARVKIRGLWGFIDKTGKVAIEPQFDELQDFSEDAAAAKREETWGFIDRQGRWMIEPQFSSVNGFAHGRAAVMQNGKWGYIDRSGKWVIQPAYNSAGTFNGRSAVVSEGPQRGLMIDMAGRVIKRFDSNVHVYNWPNAFGLYLGKVTFEQVLMHRDGRSMPQPEAQYLQYSEGLLLAAKQVRRGDDTVMLYGALDFKGNWVVSPKFSKLESFHQGLAIASPEAADKPVRPGPGHGLVDRNGKFKVAPVYRSIYRDRQGWYRAKRAGQGEDILGVNGDVLASFDCDEIETVSLTLSDARDWAVLSGCQRTWVLHQGARAFRSDIVNPTAQSTGEHMLLVDEHVSEADEDKPRRFELLNAAGRRVLSSADVGFTSKYDSVILIATDTSRPLPAGRRVPIALLNRGYKSVQVVTPNYKIVSNPEWAYDNEINDYGRFHEESPMEGPLPLKTEEGWGAVDVQGRWVIQPNYSRLDEFRHGVAFARKERQPLMLDASGKEHAFPEDVRQLQPIAPFVVEGRTGDDRRVRIDLRSGQQTVVVPPQGVRVDKFFNGLAAVQQDDKWGLLDEQGRWVVAPASLNGIEAVLNGETKTLVGWKTARYIRTDRGNEALYGWIDAKGAERIAPRYNELHYDENAAVLMVRDLHGLHGALGVDGGVLIAPLYERVSYLGEGWFSVQRKEQQGLIDAEGEWALKPGLLPLSDMGQERTFRAVQRGEEIMLYDAQGRVSTRKQPLVVTPDDPASWRPQGTETSDGSEHTVFYGVDFKERVRIPGRVGSDKRFSEGVIVFSPSKTAGERQRLGLADVSGKVLGFYAFDDIEAMHDGFALVEQRLAVPRKAGKRAATEYEERVRFGYIDRQGKPVLPPVYESATEFSDERAVVVVQGNIGLIDTKGKLLLHSAWLCGRDPIILNDKKQIVWPQEARDAARVARRCS